MYYKETMVKFYAIWKITNITQNFTIDLSDGFDYVNEIKDNIKEESHTEISINEETNTKQMQNENETNTQNKNEESKNLTEISINEETSTKQMQNKNETNTQNKNEDNYDIFFSEYNDKDYKFLDKLRDKLKNVFDEIGNTILKAGEENSIAYNTENGYFAKRMDDTITLCWKAINNLVPQIDKFNIEVCKRAKSNTNKKLDLYRSFFSYVNWSILELLALIYERRKEYDNAIKVCDIGLKLCDDKMKIWGNLGSRKARLEKKKNKTTTVLKRSYDKSSTPKKTEKENLLSFKGDDNIYNFDFNNETFKEMKMEEHNCENLINDLETIYQKACEEYSIAKNKENGFFSQEIENVINEALKAVKYIIPKINESNIKVQSIIENSNEKQNLLYFHRNFYYTNWYIVEIMAKIYEQRKEYEKAKDVCNFGLSLFNPKNLWWNFEKRKERLEKKMQKPQKKLPNTQNI